MEFINNMELASGLFQNPCIKVMSSFFGLRKKVMYTPTNSVIKGGYLEYDYCNGQKVQMLLDAPWESIEALVRKLGCPKAAENGMFCLSFCYSQDRRFAALQLCRYVGFDYVPIHDIRFAEGDEAEALLHPFVN